METDGTPNICLSSPEEKRPTKGCASLPSTTRDRRRSCLDTSRLLPKVIYESEREDTFEPTLSAFTWTSTKRMPDDGRMADEYNRRWSFTDKNWPAIFGDCGKDGKTMARAGWYKLSSSHTTRIDGCRCPFCGLECYSWKARDNPYVEHKIWSQSKCPWILSLEHSSPEVFEKRIEIE